MKAVGIKNDAKRRSVYQKRNPWRDPRAAQTYQLIALSQAAYENATVSREPGQREERGRSRAQFTFGFHITSGIDQGNAIRPFLFAGGTRHRHCGRDETAGSIFGKMLDADQRAVGMHMAEIGKKLVVTLAENPAPFPGKGHQWRN
ncbi:MAG: hypothetical protein WCI38_07410 [Chthoniobacterales bacterium]